MHRGYVLLWRCIKDNHFWQDKPFDRGRAWIDLLLIANHKEGVLRSRGISITVSRGQIGWSEVSLAEKWGWSRGKVRRFLKDLVNQGQIEQQNNNVTSLITITNYESYQTNGTASDTADGTTNGQQTDSKQYPKKECKKNDKNKELAEKSRKAPTGDHKFFIDWWCYAFESVLGSKYPFKAKDAALVKNILSDCGKLTVAISYSLYLLLSEDPFYDTAGRTIGILSNQLASLKSKKIDWPPIVEEARLKKIVPDEGIKFEDWRFWENP